jgi:hypothetical protein
MFTLLATAYSQGRVFQGLRRDPWPLSLASLQAEHAESHTLELRPMLMDTTSDTEGLLPTAVFSRFRKSEHHPAIWSATMSCTVGKTCQSLGCGSCSSLGSARLGDQARPCGVPPNRKNQVGYACRISGRRVQPGLAYHVCTPAIQPCTELASRHQSLRSYHPRTAREDGSPLTRVWVPPIKQIQGGLHFLCNFR